MDRDMYRTRTAASVVSCVSIGNTEVLRKQLVLAAACHDIALSDISNALYHPSSEPSTVQQLYGSKSLPIIRRRNRDGVLGIASRRLNIT